MKDYSKYTYKELTRENEVLSERLKEIEEETLAEGKPFSEFCERSYDVKEQLYFIDKYLRLKQEPVVEYGKEWQGDFFTLEQFQKDCDSNLLTDDDGYGYYASETSKSDVIIRPSDVKEQLLRTDFSHVLWFGK